MPVQEDPTKVYGAEQPVQVTEQQKAEGAEAMRIAKINHPTIDWQADPLTGAPLVAGSAENHEDQEPQPQLDPEDPDSPHVIPTQQAEKERTEKAIADLTAEPTGKSKTAAEANAKAMKAAEKSEKEAKDK